MTATGNVSLNHQHPSVGSSTGHIPAHLCVLGSTSRSPGACEVGPAISILQRPRGSAFRQMYFVFPNTSLQQPRWAKKGKEQTAMAPKCLKVTDGNKSTPTVTISSIY